MKRPDTVFQKQYRKFYANLLVLVVLYFGAVLGGGLGYKTFALCLLPGILVYCGYVIFISLQFRCPYCQKRLEPRCRPKYCYHCGASLTGEPPANKNTEEENKNHED